MFFWQDRGLPAREAGGFARTGIDLDMFCLSFGVDMIRSTDLSSWWVVKVGATQAGLRMYPNEHGVGRYICAL